MSIQLGDSFRTALYDPTPLPERVLESLSALGDLHRLQGVASQTVSRGVTIYPLHPKEAGQPWTLELFDLSQSYATQNPASSTTLLWVIEGKMTVQIDTMQQTLDPGHALRVIAGSHYSITPHEKGCRFLSVHLPSSSEHHSDSTAPDADAPDTFVDKVCLSAEHQSLMNRMTLLDSHYYQERFVNGANTAYDIIGGATSGRCFNISILDVIDSSRHFHKIETGRLLVLGGELKADLNGKEYLVQTGQMVRISPRAVHRLQSTQSTPVRLLCLNLPAFDPSDVHPFS